MADQIPVPIVSGNIDYETLPVLKNDDGTVSSVSSKSFGFDEGEVLLPTISADGRRMSDDEIKQQYRDTGKHLGIFKTPDDADAYAEAHHAEMGPQDKLRQAQIEQIRRIDTTEGLDSNNWLQQYRFPQSMPWPPSQLDPTMAGDATVAGTISAGKPFLDRYKDAVSEAKDGWDYWNKLAGFAVDETMRGWGVNNPDKASDIMALAQYHNWSPEFVKDNYDAITGQAKEKLAMGVGSLIAMPMLRGPAAASGVFNVADEALQLYNAYKYMALGVAGAEVIDQGSRVARSYHEDVPLSESRPYGLQDMLPKYANDQTEAISGLLDGIVKFGASQLGMAGVGSLWKSLAYDQVSSINGGRPLYMDPARIEAYRNASPDKAYNFRHFTQSIGIQPEEFNDALLNGIDLEIPLTKVTGNIDKPWWADFKNFFRSTPKEYADLNVDVMGDLKGSVHGSASAETGESGAPSPSPSGQGPTLSEAMQPGQTASAASSPFKSPAPAMNRYVEGELETQRPDGSWGPEQNYEEQIDAAKKAWAANQKTAPPGRQTAPAGSVETAIRAEATKQGVPPDLQVAIWKAEGAVTNPATKNPTSNATGIFQHMPGTWAAQGGTPENRLDQAKQIELGVALTKANVDTLTKSLGRAPEAWEVYAAHQQGSGGFQKLLDNPDAKAVDVINPKAVTLNGGTADMTASEFLDHIKQYFSRQSSATGPVRSQVAEAIQKNPDLSQPQKDALISRLDQAAQFAASREEMTPDEWYDRHVAGEMPPMAGELQSKYAPEPWQMRPDQFLDLHEFYTESVRAAYFDENDMRVAGSALTTPWSGELPPVGTWGWDRGESGTGDFGISQLRAIDPNDQKLRLPELDQHGHVEPVKQPYVKQYEEWFQEGKKPYPVDMVQSKDGTLTVVDGHRRVLAARRAGTSLLAWVEPPNKNDMPMTRRDAIEEALSQGKSVPYEVLKDYPDLLAGAKKSAIVSEPENAYVEESKRVRRELEKQGQQNAFVGGNIPSRSAGPARPGSPAPLPREPLTTTGKAFGEIREKPVQVIGQKIKSYADIADLGQGWRNPNYEEFRYLLIKAGEIIDHEGVTARMPGSTPWFHGDPDKYIDHLRQRIKATGADSVVALHNHPSGKSTPSEADVDVTKTLAKIIPEFSGHVVINSGEYSVIDPEGNVTTHRMPNLPDDWQDPILTASVPHEALNARIVNQGDIAAWAKVLTREKNLPVLMYLSAGMTVRGLQEISPEALCNVDLMRATIPQKLVDFGSASVAVAMPENATSWHPADQDAVARLVLEHHVFLDAVGNRADGSMWSVQDENEKSMAETFNYVGGKPIADFKTELIREKQEAYKALLKTLSSDADAAPAMVRGILAREAGYRANPIHGLNGEYGRAMEEQERYGAGEDEYSAVQAEAVKRADAIIQQTEAALLRKATAALRRQAEFQYEDMPEFKIIKELEVQGLNRKSLDLWDRDTVTQLVRRFPGLISKQGAWTPDVAADLYLGPGKTDDDFMQMLLSLPTKAAFIEDFITDGLRHYEEALSLTAAERHAILVGQEIQVMREAAGGGMSEADQLAAMMPEGMSAPWVNATTPGIKQDINQRMLAKQRGSETVGSMATRQDYENLKAGIKMAARSSRIAFNEGMKTQAVKDAVRRRELLGKAIAEKLRQKNLIDDLKSRYRARDDMRKLVDKINRIANASTTSGTIEDGEKERRVTAALPVEYRKQIAQILKNVGWKGFDRVSIQNPEPLSDFLSRKDDAGETYESNFAGLELMTGKGLAQLSLDSLRDLHDCLNELFHKARTSGLLKTAEGFKRLQDAVAEAAHRTIEYHNPNLIPKKAQGALAPYAEAPGFGEKVKSFLRNFLVTGNLEVETLLEWMDGFTHELGPNWKYGYRPINDGTSRLYDLEKRSAEFAKILDRFATKIKGIGSWSEQKYQFPELGGAWLRKQQMMAFALHYGNEGNRNAVKNSFKVEDKRGIPQPLTDAQVWAVISKLTREEWQAVLDAKNLWNNPESRQVLADAYLENTGNEFPFLELGRVTIPHFGEVDEWHAPMIDDKRASYEMERRGAKDEMKDLFSQNYRPKSPKNGFTKQRVAGASHILNLEFISMVSRFLADQNRYIALTGPLRDVGKFFSAPAFRLSVENYLDKDFYRMLMPWLQDIARPQSEILSGVVKTLATLRRNGVMMHIAMKPWTAIKHIGQLLMVAESVTGPRVLHAILNPYNGVLLRPWTARQIIEQDNPAMQGFFNKWERDLPKIYQNFNPDHWAIRTKFNAFGMMGIEIMVNFLARVAWMSENSRRLEETRGDVLSAREYANKIVRDNLGSYDPKDLSKMRRGNELEKQLTTFSTVPAALFQKFFRVAAQATGPNQGDLWHRSWRFVRSAVYLVVALAYLEAFFEKRRMPSAKEFLTCMPLTIAHAFPVLGDVLNSAVTGRDYHYSVVSDAINDMAKLVGHGLKVLSGEKEDLSKLSFEASVDVAGYGFGLPTDQMRTTGEGLYHWGEEGYEPWNLMWKPPAPEEGSKKKVIWHRY